MIHKVKHYILNHPLIKRVSHKAETMIHATYCGAVWMEGHGIYSTMGGLLMAAVIVNVMLGENDA